MASRIESEIWSAILSGCPSVTDSDVNKYRPLRLIALLGKRLTRRPKQESVTEPPEVGQSTMNPMTRCQLRFSRQLRCRLMPVGEIYRIPRAAAPPERAYKSASSRGRRAPA